VGHGGHAHRGTGVTGVSLGRSINLEILLAQSRKCEDPWQ
jgi:hypothetical protein